ncbi:MAG: hypothetical protein IJ091_00885 [Oscillospiraceae bacterium]|nr:hypothetical protein [Oscillospiraceae bacterium]
MKKAISILLLVIVCFSFVACGGEEPVKPHDFRNVDWGMSQKKVIDAEGTDYLYADETLLYFAGEELGQPVELYYEFDDDKVFSAECKFVIQDGMILSDCIENYIQLREQLIELYGEPNEEDYHVWKSEEDKETYGLDKEQLPIYYQVLTYYNSWNTDTCFMELSLDYTNLQIGLILRASEVVQETEEG